MRRNTGDDRRGRRDGYLTPALAMALLTCFLIAAVVLNIGWRRAAEREIAVAADAAALAAAGELASDDRLLDAPLTADALARVADRADRIASKHSIVGTPAQVVRQDLRIGRRVTGDDGSRLLETSYQPLNAAVTVRRGADGNMPWLFRAGGSRGGRLVASAEAGIDPRVAALRPGDGRSVPAWPVALRSSAADRSAEADSTPSVGWRDQVELRLGPDRFGYDRDTGRVVDGPDGLHELVADTLSPDGEPDEVGVTLVDLGQSFGAEALGRTFRDGLTEPDLAVLGGEVPVATLPSSPAVVDALPRLPLEAEQQLRIGQAKAVFLFGNLSEAGAGFSARLDRVVVARLMDAEPIDGGRWRLTFQPAVLATGAAVLATGDAPDAPENRYLYKVRLTR